MSLIVSAITGTMTMGTPLLLAALGENVVQKAGVVNVGLEGMILIGAFAASVATYYSGNPYVGLLAAALAGLLFALLFAFFALRLTANQVVIGIVLNLLALGLTGTAYRALFGKTGSFITTASLPKLFGELSILTLLALLAVPLVWWWLNRTRRGLELRACGEQPTAAEAAGVNVLRARTRALLFGGVMAGIAGAFLSIAQTNTFVENMSAGRGFIALAIVTSGRWSPVGCLAAAAVFGLAQALQFQWQALRGDLPALFRGLPYQAFLALPYLVTLFILAFGGRWSRSPAALGHPYRRA